MITTLWRFKCDHCGKEVVIEVTPDIERIGVAFHPEGWATVRNGDYPRNSETFHFSSHKCYKAYKKEHSDDIEPNASFYAASEWFK